MRNKKHLIAISKIAKLLSFALAFLAVFVVAAFSSSNKANAQSEQVGVDFFMVKITSETIPNNDDAFTTASLPKFKAVDKDDVLAWTCPESGICIVLYQDNLNKCLHYNNGSFVNDASIINPTNANILNGVASGISYYYTASEIPTSGSVAPGTYVYGVESTNYRTLTLYNNTNTTGQWYKSDTKDGSYSLCGNAETLVLAKNDTTAVGWYKFENTDPINVLFFDRNTGIFSNGMVYSDAYGAGETAHDWLIGNDKNTTYYNISQTRLKYYSFNVYGSYDVPDDSNAYDKFRGKTVIFASSSEEMWNAVSLDESNPAQANNEDIIGTYYNSQKLSLFSAYPSEKGVVFNVTLGDAQKSFLIESTMKLGHTNTYKHLFDSYNANNTNITLKLKDDTSLDYCYSIAAPADATAEQKQASTAFKFVSNPTYMSIGKYTDTKCWANTHADSSSDTQKIGTYNNDANVVVDSYGIDRAMIASWTNCQPGDVISFEISLGKADDILVEQNAGPKHTHADGIEFEDWTATDSLPTVAGNYCLTEDVTLTTNYDWDAPTGTTNLCLNGHAIIITTWHGLKIGAGATFNLYDCGTSTRFITTDADGYFGSVSDVTSEGAIEVVGGFVAGSRYCGIIAAGGTFNMYGGTVCCNDTGVGVYNGESATFNMNGGSISYNIEAGVYAGQGTMTMNDGIISHNHASYLGGGILASGDIDLTINGGSIIYNIVEDGEGGGIYVDGDTIKINGGVISHNKATNGAGVYLNTGTLTINGGEISENVATSPDGGGGVYVHVNYITISGNPVIANNYSNGNVINNLYLEQAKRVKINKDAPLSTGAQIGVSMQVCGVFLNEDGSTYKDYFTSDNTNYVVKTTANNELTLVSKHEHNFTYVANGNKITASCSAEGCPITTGLEVIMEAPENLVYDGDIKKIGFTNGYNSEAFQGLVIKYYKGTEEVECKNAGTYVCKATIGGVTAQLEFTIAKAESNPVAQDYDTYYGKKLSEIILDEGWAWDNPNEYVGNVGDHYYSATYTPEDTENYKTKTMELLVTVVIAIPDYTLPTGLKVLINKTLADVTLPAGFSWKNATQNVGEEVGEKIFKATYTPEDTENYEIVENIDVTVLVYAHEHNLSYTASGATITATCSAEGCPLDNKQATLTLVAPANLVYDGTAKAATFEEGYNQEVFASPVIKYYKGTEEVASCINAGDYVGKVTYGEATAQVSFTITKAESNPVAQDYDTYYGKKLSEIILDEGWAWDNPNEYVGNVGDHYYSATYTPEDTDNYKTKTMELLVTVVIAIPDYTVPTGLKVLINKTLADVTLPAGFSWKNATQNVGEEVGEKIFKATYTPEDTENYEIVENIDVTVLVYAHEHSFTYKANGSTITAKCNNDACYITEGLELKLLAPTGNMVYDGNTRVATLEEGYDEEAFPNPVIKYYKGTQEVTSCVDAGNYVAKVTYGNATAQVSFTIETWNIKDPKGVEATIEGAPYTDNVTIVVEVKTSLSEQQVQADYDKIKNKLEANEDISKIYEVKLIRTVNGVSTEIQPSDIKAGTEITIVMTLPEEVIKAGSFRILHIHNADDVEFITNFVVNGKTVSFKVSRLSEFAFILKSTPENHGFCIGWVLFIIMILQIMYLCFFCLLPVFNKKGKLVGKMDLFKLIGIGTAIATLFFAVIVLALHACTIAVVSSILSAFICIAYIVIMIIGMVRIPAKE